MNSFKKIKKYNIFKKFIILFSLIVLIFFSFISLFNGIVNITPTKLLFTFFEIGNPENFLSKREIIIFLDLRLARVILGITAGFGLAISGSIMQSITGNKMSSPFTTGISSAASMGAATAILFFMGTSKSPDFLIIFSAFIFALLCSALVYTLSTIRGMNKTILILVGIAFNYLFSSGNAALQFIANDEALSSIVNWNFGNLSGVSWNKIYILVGIVIIFSPYFYLNRFSYNVISTGDESAISLGIDVKKLRFFSGIMVTFISAAIVSFIGIIAFVGIIAPHLARMLIGDDQRYTLPLSGIIGSTLIILSDYIGRTIISPIIIPIGIIISFVGVPLFLYLIIKSKRV